MFILLLILGVMNMMYSVLRLEDENTTGPFMFFSGLFITICGIYGVVDA